jgi:hypothetical protein
MRRSLRAQFFKHAAVGEPQRVVESIAQLGGRRYAELAPNGGEHVGGADRMTGDVRFPRRRARQPNRWAACSLFLSVVRRWLVSIRRTAIPNAFLVPTITTSFLRLVTPPLVLDVRGHDAEPVEGARWRAGRLAENPDDRSARAAELHHLAAAGAAEPVGFISPLRI